MRAALFVGLLAVASAFASEEVIKGYHEEIGIPLAKSIEESEQQSKAGGQGNNQFGQRIIGGSAASLGDHPYFAGLLITLADGVSRSACGSSLVSADRVVTAAHCWTDGKSAAKQVVVVLGSTTLFSGGTRVTSTKAAVHPDWNPSKIANDVAVIYLPNAVSLSKNIQPISLPSSSELSDSFTGQWAVAVGFGKTSDKSGVSRTANQVKVQVISNSVCRSTFGSYVRSSNICTKGDGVVGICNGDSGGPLALDNNGRKILIGVSSFVSGSGCENSKPSAFARITSFVDFIKSNLQTPETK